MNGDDSDEVGCEAYPGRCDFEHGLCVWEQDRTDDFDWTRNQGTTPSSATGPLTDHTTGQSTGKHTLHFFEIIQNKLLCVTITLCFISLIVALCSFRSLYVHGDIMAKKTRRSSKTSNTCY